MRDAATDFAKLDVQVYGISRDDVAALAAFAKAQDLSFPLLSDPDGSVALKYAAGMADRPMTKRLTFVIDDKGILRHVDDKVDVAKHGAALVELIGKLRQK